MRLLKALKKLLFHPEHPVKILWDLYILILTLVLAYWVPFSLSFLQDLPENMLIFEFIVTISYILDILINFNTSFYQNGTLISKRIKIAKKYLKTYFWIDILSSFPYDWLQSSPFANTHTSNPSYFGFIKLFKFIRMAKLLRLFRTQKIFYKIEDYILNEFLSVIYAILKIAIVLSIMAHWIACLFYFVSSAQSNITDKTWVKSFLNRSEQDVEVSELYVTSLYWAFTTMITVGYGDIVPENPLEMVVSMGCMILTCGYFAYIIGNMGTLMSTHLAYEQRKAEVRVGIGRYLKKKAFPKELQTKVMAFIDNLMENIKNYRLRDYEVLNLLSHPLRNEILYYLYHDILQKCEVFSKYFSDSTRAALTNALEIENFSPNDVIFYEKQHTRKLYFICSGLVNMMHDRTNLIYKRLHKDDQFGEIGFFIGQARTATAKCSDFTLVQSLDLKDALMYTNDSKFQEILATLTASCGKNNYSALLISCYLCDCLGHVAKDCKIEKIQSGLESIAANYRRRKTKVSKFGDTFDQKPVNYKKKIVPERYFKHKGFIQEKIDKFVNDKDTPKHTMVENINNKRVVEDILEVSEEDDCDFSN